jgi:hypothetical protein
VSYAVLLVCFTDKHFFNGPVHCMVQSPVAMGWKPRSSKYNAPLRSRQWPRAIKAKTKNEFGMPTVYFNNDSGSELSTIGGTVFLPRPAGAA